MPLAAPGQRAKEREHARLVHRVVERRRHERGVRAKRRCRGDLELGPGQVALRHAADDRDAAGVGLHDRCEHRPARTFVQRRALPRRAKRKQTRDAARKDVAHQPSDSRLIDAAVARQRGGERRYDAGEVVNLQHMCRLAPPPDLPTKWGGTGPYWP